MQIVYEITVKNWEKYNPGKTKNFTKFFISARFFDDYKIATSTSLERLLYVAILARCCDERSATTRTTRDQYLTMIGQRRYDIVTALNHLQEKQLVTWENPLPKLIEGKLKEGKTSRREVNLTSDFDLSKNSENQSPENLQFFQEKIKKKNDVELDKSLKESTKKVWEAYKDSYVKRYGIEPKRNVKVNSQIKQLTQRLGYEDAIKTVEFYLTHNDSQFLKNSHSIGLCLFNAENLFSQMQRGVQITQSKINAYNKECKYQDMIDDIERNGI